VIGANSAFELESPLIRYLPWVAAVGIEAVVPDDLGDGPDREDPVPEPTVVTAEVAVPVPLSRTRRLLGRKRA
jgi:hypothetical protein